MDLLVVALAVALGAAFAGILGFLAGVGRGLQLAASRRATSGASSLLASVMPDAIPERTPADILAGIIPIRLGGVRYELRVKSRRESREWLATLDERFRLLGDALSQADTPEILRALAAHTDDLYDLLAAYAGPDVIPVRDGPEDFATEAEILHATLGVWAALHPLAVTLVAAAETMSPTSGPSPAPPSRSRKRTAGVPTTSTSA